MAEEAQGIKKEEQPENKIIRKKIIARDISTQPQETKEEKIIIKKEEEPQTKILRKKIISKDIKLEESPIEEITYQIVKFGRKRNPMIKVVKRIK